MWSIQTNIEEPVPGCAGWVNLEISGMPSGPECLRIVPDWPNWRSASRSLSRWGGDQNNCNSYNSKDNINPKVIWTWRCISTVERRVASIIIMLREDPLSLMRSAFFFCGGGGCLNQSSCLESLHWEGSTWVLPPPLFSSTLPTSNGIGLWTLARMVWGT